MPMSLKGEIARRGLQSQVRLLGLLDRPTQIQVMRTSAAVVQASFFEGWSALVEDSRALGKRIFVSDIPVHREQNPDDAVYFNPDSAEELADLIEADWPHLEPGPDLGREQRARDGTGEADPRFRASVCRRRWARGAEPHMDTMTLARAADGTVNLHIWREGEEYLRQKGHSFLNQWNNLVFAALPGPPLANTRYVDLSTTPLGFADETFDAVYAYHVFEHLTPSHGTRCAQQILSALKAGGILRVSVPDLETACRTTSTRSEAAGDRLDAAERGALPVGRDGDFRADGERALAEA